MRKIVLTAIAMAALLISATAYAGAQFKVLAPAEESFIGMDQILIIGKVEGFNEAKMVEISSNGKAMGFAPLQNENFSFKAVLAEGRHEITLAAPGIDRKTIKIFVGKQKGYRYHIEPDMGYCENCHPEAAANVEFGGPERNRLFICASQSLYAVYLRINGAESTSSRDQP